MHSLYAGHGLAAAINTNDLTGDKSPEGPCKELDDPGHLIDCGDAMQRPAFGEPGRIHDASCKEALGASIAGPADAKRGPKICVPVSARWGAD